MNYIIFGGSGFIGTHLVNILKERDSDSVIYNLDVVENNHGGKSVFLDCDVRKPIDFEFDSSLESVIFNFAAVHRTPGHPDFEYFETNIYGARNVMTFAEQYGVTKIIFTSSIAPYGAAEDLKTEDTLPTPNTPYGISKLTAEKILQIWQAKNSDRKLIIVRPGVVFGKGENGNFTRLYWGIRKRYFFYAGRKDTIKASIYVKDLVGFILYKLENQQNGFELFNCTYEPAYKIQYIVETIKKVTGLNRNTIKINATFLKTAAILLLPFGGKKLGLAPARIKKLMISTNINGGRLAKSGYKFKYTFEEAIEDWYKDNDNKYLK